MRISKTPKPHFNKFINHVPDRREQKRRRDDESSSANDWIDPRVPTSKSVAQPRPQEQAQDAGHAQHEAEDERNAVKKVSKTGSFMKGSWNGPFFLDAGIQPVLGPDLDAVLDVERAPPAQGAGAERQTSKS